MHKHPLAILIVLFLLTACTSPAAEPLNITNAWVRPALTGQTSAVYFTIRNPGKTTDVLHEARSLVAGSTELHMTRMDDQGVMSMHPQHGVEIPAVGQVVFEPGGLHVMLVDLKQDLKAGDTIVLSLVFEKNGEVTLSIPVKEAP